MVAKKPQKPRSKPQAEPAGDSQFRSLIETALDVVVVLNYDGTIRYSSPSVQRVTGYSSEELLGRNAFSYIHKDDTDEEFEVFKAVVSDPSRDTVGEPHSFRFRHKDGHWVVLESVSTKLPEGPEPPGTVVNARDVIGQRQAHEAIRQLAEQERRSAQENEVIAELGRIIGSTLNIEEVFELFTEQVRRLISFDMVVASVVDYDQQTATVRYWSGPEKYRKNFRTTVPLNGSLLGEVIDTGKPVLVHGMSDEDVLAKFPHLSKSHRGGVLSWLGLPLINRGKIIGGILLLSSKPDAFSDLDVALGSRVSYQIAGAIDNAGLFDELKVAEADLASSVIERSEAANQNEVIAEIGRIISSALNIEEVYEPFADQVRKLIDFDVLAICIVDREGRMGRIAHRVGDGRVGGMSGSLVPIKGSITGEVAELKHSIIVQGLSEKKLKERFPFTVISYQADVRSWLCTPLINGGEFVGSLLVLTKKKNAFTDADSELAQRVGNQIAGAIDSVRLYEDLKKVESALTDSVNRNQMILETAHDAFVGIDDQGQVIAWNSQAEVMFGWAAGEAMGRRLSDLIIPPRFARKHLNGIKNFLATRKGTVVNQRVEMVAQHHDGHEFPVELTISPLKLGESYIFNAFIRDITAPKEAEDALKRSEERFRAVYNNAANGIGTRTLDGTPKDLNPAFLDMVGYTMDEVRELAPGVLYETKYLEIEKGLFDRALQGEEIPPYEKEYIRKDGSRVSTEIRASLERDDEGNPSGIVAVVTDISERQKLEQEIAQYTKTLEQANEELQQLDRLKDEFISTVSHELRTPLASIKGSAEILLTFDDEDRETRMEFLRIINKECDRLTRLVTDVLDLSRMESRQASWFWEDVDLPEVVAAVDGTQSLWMQKDLAINVDLEPDLPGLWNDRDRLVQVVTNLVSSSIKFTPEGGKISIKAKKLAADKSDGLGQKLQVCVSDTGIGIRESEYENIFQKFKQVAESLTDKPTGTGLGLPICKEIVEYFGGKIWVESKLGKGSSFYFTVPVTAEERVLRPEPEPNGSTPGPT
jgi:PAS domain S-box-containing protein